MVIRMYVSLTSGNTMMRVQQDYIKRVFDTKSIPYEEVDIAAPQCAQDKKFMQEVVGRTKHQSSAIGDEQQQQPNKPVLPPQLFHNDAYRGDFDGFFEAVESETVFKYLGLAAPPDEVEYQRQQQQQQSQQQLSQQHNSESE